MTAPLPPVHPGQVLRDEFVRPLGITDYYLNMALNEPHPTALDLMRGAESITPERAVRLGTFLGTTAAFWLNLQYQYDLRMIAEDPNRDVWVRTVRPWALGGGVP